MLEHDFAPQFKLKLAAKDARLVVDAAAERELSLPVLEEAQRRFDESAREHGDLDLSATFLTLDQ